MERLYCQPKNMGKWYFPKNEMLSWHHNSFAEEGVLQKSGDDEKILSIHRWGKNDYLASKSVY